MKEKKMSKIMPYSPHLIPTLGNSVYNLHRKSSRPPQVSQFNQDNFIINFIDPESSEQLVGHERLITQAENIRFKLQEYGNRKSNIRFSYLPTEYSQPRQIRKSTYTKTWETPHKLIRDEAPSLEPYWVIEEFNRALRIALGQLKLTNRKVIDNILRQKDLVALYEFSRSVSLDVMCVEILKAVVVRLNTYLAHQSSSFRGSNLFSTAYDAVLMSDIYSSVLLDFESVLDNNLKTMLSRFRSIFIKFDYHLDNALTDLTKGLWASVRITDNGIPAEPQNISFIDLFAGVGSFRKAFESAGAKCVWTNDIIADSMTVYSENFDVGEGELLTGDVRSVIPRHIKSRGEGGDLQEALNHIPDTAIDFVLAGFPCKSFSKFGQLARSNAAESVADLYTRLFLNDVRYGRLIFDTLEIIKQVNAKGFVFENVPEFINMWVPVAAIKTDTYKKLFGFDVDLSSSEMKLRGNLEYIDEKLTPNIPKKTRQLCVNLFNAVIIPAFNHLRSDGLGFDISWNVSNARNYGAQSRSRVFIVGVRKDISDGTPFKFENVPFASTETPPTFQQNMCHTRVEQAEPPYTLPFLGGSIVNPKYNISLLDWNRLKEKVFKVSRTDPNFNNFRPQIPFGIGTFGNEILPEEITEGLDSRLTYYGTLLSGGINETKIVYYRSVVKPKVNVYRCLTPREAARLMTFDPSRCTRMPNPTTDARFYQQCGFSIVTRHLKEIVLPLCSLFARSKK